MSLTWENICDHDESNRGYSMIGNIRILRKLFTLLVLTALMTLIAAAKVSAISISEMEPNDSAAQSNSIKIGQSIYGSSGEYNRDWFSFKAPISGTVEISLWCDDEDVVSRDIHPLSVDVYDGNINDVAYNVRSTSAFGVICGRTYYVRARNDARYSDSDYHFKLSYKIGKTAIKTVKPAKKAFIVTWSKKANASSYQVQYVKKSVYQDYGWSKAKTVKASNKSKKIKGLAKKRKYYVRVRVARKIDGITYYSAWSPKKTVKTK